MSTEVTEGTLMIGTGICVTCAHSVSRHASADPLSAVPGMCMDTTCRCPGLIEQQVPAGTNWSGFPAGDTCPVCRKRTSSVQDVKAGWCGNCARQTRVATDLTNARRIVSAQLTNGKKAQDLTCRQWWPVAHEVGAYDPHRPPHVTALCHHCGRQWNRHPEPYAGTPGAAPRSQGTVVLVAVKAVQRPYDTAHALAIGCVVGNESPIVVAIQGGLTIEAMGHTLRSMRQGMAPTAATKVAVNVWLPEAMILHRAGAEVGPNAAALAGYGTYIGQDVVRLNGQTLIRRGQGVIITESAITQDPVLGEGSVVYVVRLDPLDPKSEDSEVKVITDVNHEDLAINTNWRAFDPTNKVTPRHPFNKPQGWAEWDK